MPRSPSDATRFTSTGPYVSTKQSSNATSFVPNSHHGPPYGAAAGGAGTQLNFEGSMPKNETPLQKMARLRAAAQLARQGNETSFDKMVRIGRVWADRAHRVTALSLMAASVIGAALATAGITDMVLHNRKRRAEWLAEKQAQNARDLAIAKQAEAQGKATEDQTLLINRERAAQEAELARKNRPGMFKRASNWLFSGLSTEEQKGGKLGAAAAEKVWSTTSEKGGAPSSFAEEGRSVLRTFEDRIDANRRTGETVEELVRPGGGPLDRQAQAIADSASQSWKSWVSGQ